jgi:hypothetical protein
MERPEFMVCLQRSKCFLRAALCRELFEAWRTRHVRNPSIEEEIERADLPEVLSSFFRRCDRPEYFVKGIER